MAVGMTPEEKKQALLKRQEEINEKQKEIKRRLRKIEQEERKSEQKLLTRKKVLIGAYILHLVDSGKWTEEDLLKRMDGFLVRESERKVFGLGEETTKTA